MIIYWPLPKDKPKIKPVTPERLGRLREDDLSSLEPMQRALLHSLSKEETLVKPTHAQVMMHPQREENILRVYREGTSANRTVPIAPDVNPHNSLAVDFTDGRLIVYDDLGAPIRTRSERSEASNLRALVLFAKPYLSDAALIQHSITSYHAGDLGRLPPGMLSLFNTLGRDGLEQLCGKITEDLQKEEKTMVGMTNVGPFGRQRNRTRLYGREEREAFLELVPGSLNGSYLHVAEPSMIFNGPVAKSMEIEKAAAQTELWLGRVEYVIARATHRAPARDR